jgi:hypothetical protein
MSTNMIRLGRLVALAIALAGTLAVAQDRKLPEPASGGKVAVWSAVEGRMVVVSASPAGRGSRKETPSVNSIPLNCEIARPARNSLSAAPSRKCMARGSPEKSP